MTARARFREIDIKRAIAGVHSAGLTIARIEIDHTGKIVIIPGQSEQASELEEWPDDD